MVMGMFYAYSTKLLPVRTLYARLLICKAMSLTTALQRRILEM